MLEKEIKIYKINKSVFKSLLKKDIINIIGGLSREKYVIYALLIIWHLNSFYFYIYLETNFLHWLVLNLDVKIFFHFLLKEIYIFQTKQKQLQMQKKWEAHVEGHGRNWWAIGQACSSTPNK